MNYLNASHVLPDELLREVQKYAAGENLYIPKIEEKKKWGEGSGARVYYRQRNAEIREAYDRKVSVDELAQQYNLSIESVRKIVYRKQS
jgi:Mor family transcriptional regulator